MSTDGPLRLDLPAEQEQRLRAQARLRVQRERNDIRFAQHPWPYLRDVVFTIDPFAHQERGGGVRKYPGALLHDPTPGCTCTRGGCANYLEHVCNMWWRYPRILFPKSRRLITSWTLIACHEWLARFRPAQVIALVSRKQGQNENEGSAELVKRAKQIGENLPAEVTPRVVKSSFCRLVYPHNGSVIIGIGQGADQLRQQTITAWFADEFAFWEEAGPTYAASIPTLEGGGRFSGVSTANPGFMEGLVYDAWQA